MKLVKNSGSRDPEVEFDWLIFKTNISTKNQVQSLSLVLKAHTDIYNWTIDLNDCDYVLRLNSKTSFEEKEIEKLLNRHGFIIEPLLD